MTSIDLALESNTSTGFGEASLVATEAPGRRNDDYIMGARAGLRFVSAQSTTSVAPFVSARFLANEHYEDQYGLELAFERRFVAGRSAFGVVSYSKIDNRVADFLDGNILRLQIGYRRSLAGRASVGASLSYEDKDVPFRLDDYQLHGVRLFGAADLRYGLTLRPSLLLERRTFENPSPLFNASPNERSLDLSLTIEKNDLFFANGFSPFIDARARRTNSDIAAFGYREVKFQVGLERRL